MTSTADLVTAALRQLRNGAGRLLTPILDEAGFARLDPLAAGTAGRLVVAPGQTISSAWGNTTFDQTMVCFANVSDRDTQWTAPHEGSVCFLNDYKRKYTYVNGAWRPDGPLVLVSTSGSTLTAATATALKDTGTGDLAVTVTDPNAQYRVRYIAACQTSAASTAGAFTIKDGGAASPVAASPQVAEGDMYLPYAGGAGRTQLIAEAIVKFSAGVHTLAAFYVFVTGAGNIVATNGGTQLRTLSVELLG